MNRRDLLVGAGAMLATACARSAESPRSAAPDARGTLDASAELAALEASVGGRIGVFAYDTASGKHVARRENERFAMCSTFKWTLAAAVLARVDRGELSLDEHVHYEASDILEYAPTTGAHVGEGSMSIHALARAAVTVSDNTAANLLLAKIDGPAGFTRFVRELGDNVTRLDRNEPTLNLNVRGDVRDTTSPRAMASLMRAILVWKDALSPASREQLLGWLRACETGRERLRAGLLPDWTVGDKTGTGRGGAFNDVAIAFPRRPGGAGGGAPPPPILIAAYMSDGPSSEAMLSAAQARIGRLVAEHLGGGEPAILPP